MPVSSPAVIRPGRIEDVPLILAFIQELAEYEKLSEEVVATESLLAENLFGEDPLAEVLLAHCEGEPAALAVYFHNFSTFLGRGGIYLEDLFVRSDFRGRGIGRQMMIRLARIALERDCGRLDWAVLDWNDPALAFYERLDAQPLEGWGLFRLEGRALKALAGQS